MRKFRCFKCDQLLGTVSLTVRPFVAYCEECRKSFDPLGRSASWRVGRTIPINIYEGDRPICQCHTVEDARRIVAAMNRAREER